MNAILAALGMLITVFGALAAGVGFARGVVVVVFWLIRVVPVNSDRTLVPTSRPLAGD